LELVFELVESSFRDLSLQVEKRERLLNRMGDDDDSSGGDDGSTQLNNSELMERES